MGKGKNNEELFRSMPVAQAILTLAVPTVVSQIITIIYNMADTFFIAWAEDAEEFRRIRNDTASWGIRSRWQRQRWRCRCLCL